MPPNPRTTAETYFADLRRTRASGGATEERLSYGALATLLNAVGGRLKPKVFCVGELADQGAGHPDFGLYASNQVQRGLPRPGQTPHRGVVEVKGVEENVWHMAESDQVRRYLDRYQLVVVTNTHDFILVGTDAAGRPAKLETFHLAIDSPQRRGAVCPPTGDPSHLRSPSRVWSRRISHTRSVTPSGARRTEGPGLVARFLCTGWSRSSRVGGELTGSHDRA